MWTTVVSKKTQQYLKKIAKIICYEAKYFLEYKNQSKIYTDCKNFKQKNINFIKIYVDDDENFKQKKIKKSHNVIPKIKMNRKVKNRIRSKNVRRERFMKYGIDNQPNINSIDVLEKHYSCEQCKSKKYCYCDIVYCHSTNSFDNYHGYFKIVEKHDVYWKHPCYCTLCHYNKVRTYHNPLYKHY